MTPNLTFRISQRLSLILLLIWGISTPVTAQSVSDRVPERPVLPSNPSWHATLGQQHAQLLRSRSTTFQGRAMQNIIIIATQRPGEFDLTPTVPALLDIYQYGRTQNARTMAIAALHAIGDQAGMNELYRLSVSDRSKHTRQLAQYAAKDYYQTLEWQHERDRYSKLAQRHQKKADRQAERAEQYRKLAASIPKGN